MIDVVTLVVVCATTVRTSLESDEGENFDPSQTQSLESNSLTVLPRSGCWPPPKSAETEVWVEFVGPQRNFEEQKLSHSERERIE